MPDRIAHYARQRREFALMFSAMWIVYGITVMTTIQRTKSIDLAWMPGGDIQINGVGLSYVILGAVTAILSYESRERPTAESWAYGLLVTWPLLMGVFSMVGAALGYSETGWASGVRFMMLAFIAYHIAGLHPSNREIGKGSVSNGPT